MVVGGCSFLLLLLCVVSNNGRATWHTFKTHRVKYGCFSILLIRLCAHICVCRRELQRVCNVKTFTSCRGLINARFVRFRSLRFAGLFKFY